MAHGAGIEQRVPSLRSQLQVVCYLITRDDSRPSAGGDEDLRQSGSAMRVRLVKALSLAASQPRFATSVGSIITPNTGRCALRQLPTHGIVRCWGGDAALAIPVASARTLARHLIA